MERVVAVPPVERVADLVDRAAGAGRHVAAGDDLPVCVLSAREQVSDRVRGLEAGADDYVVKPFALEEVVARLTALLRRRPPGSDAALRVGDLELDPRGWR